MTKKSKSKNKVTSASAALESDHPSKQEKVASAATTLESKSGLSSIPNGKFKLSSTIPPSGSDSTKSLASIPGIVDDFLAPKFVKVLNFTDRGYEKKPPPDLAEHKAKLAAKNGAPVSNDKNNSGSEASSQQQQQPPEAGAGAEKKNKRKKNKPVKNTSSSNLDNVFYDSEDGRELDVLGGGGGGGTSFNGNNNGTEYHPSSFQNHLKAGLTPREVNSLKRLERIRSSATAVTSATAALPTTTPPRRYEGNNIVLVANDDDDGGAQYPQTSCYDDYNYNYNYDADDDLVAAGAGATGLGGAGVFGGEPPSNNSILGFDHDEDDDDEREGSWSLSHQVDYAFPPKNQHHQASTSIASSSVASSESENNNVGSSGSSKKCYPALASCTSILDGANNPCEIRDCTKPTTKKCSQCKNAFYCGEDHQRLDWKKHKNECIPYKMESRFGDDVSVAVAARNIPAGQVIFKDKPLLVIPMADPENDFLNVMDLPCIKCRLKKKPDIGEGGAEEEDDSNVCCKAVKPACFGCLKSVEFVGPPRYSCTRCRLPLCSYKCHLDTYHQSAECQAIQTVGGWVENHHSCYHSMYMDIEIIRALQLGNYDTSLWDRFLQMRQNLRVEAYKNSRRYQRFIENFKELVPISAKMSGYNDDLIGNVHAIITALSFRPSLKSPYKLLFATQILFGHDCIPNTFHYLEESPNGLPNRLTLVTKAAEPIVKKAIITIDFSPTPFLYYPLRRMILRNVLSIDNCNCKRCQNPSAIGDRTNDIKCPSCDPGLISPEKASKWSNSVWACTSCLEEFPYQTVLKITGECRDELANILNQSTRQFVVPALQQFITRREKDLNPGHSIIIQAWSFIEAHLRPSLAATRLPGPAPRYPESTLEEYRALKRSCDAIQGHLDAIRPGICYERGCILFNRYYIEIAQAAKKHHLRLTQRREYIQELMGAVKMLQEALKIFQMFEGFNRDVALHIQDTTSALCKTKSYIQEMLMSENEESKSKRLKAAMINSANNASTSSTVA